MTKPRLPMFDCDNHIYEPNDAVTRYLPAEYLNKAITPVTLANGEEGLLAGGRLVAGLDHPIDKAHRPGALKEMLRQMKSGKPTETYALEDLRPEYLDRDALPRPHGRAAGRPCVALSRHHGHHGRAPRPRHPTAVREPPRVQRVPVRHVGLRP